MEGAFCAWQTERNGRLLNGRWSLEVELAGALAAQRDLVVVLTINLRPNGDANFVLVDLVGYGGAAIDVDIAVDIYIAAAAAAAAAATDGRSFLHRDCYLCSGGDDISLALLFEDRIVLSAGDPIGVWNRVVLSVQLPIFGKGVLVEKGAAGPQSLHLADGAGDDRRRQLVRAALGFDDADDRVGAFEELGVGELVHAAKVERNRFVGYGHVD